MVAGKPITETPRDLFIPPDALEVLLDSFSGPLDLLLYLIRRDKIDILDIPIAHITQQYMHYIELMEVKRMELAVDYLVMAAMLAEIKSRLLLPIVTTEEDSDEDPRMELVRRLQIYEQFKQAASRFDALPRRERDIFEVRIKLFDLAIQPRLPNVSLDNLVHAYKAVMLRQTQVVHHQVQREPLSVRERMARVLQRLEQEEVLELTTLFHLDEGRMGLVVAFLAILELAKQSLLILIQADLFTPIYLKANRNE